MSVYCGPCERWFECEYDRQKHRQYSRRHRHYCFRCDRDFVNAEARGQHIRDSHSHWICNWHNCSDLDFPSYEARRTHWESTAHPYYCHICEEHYGSAHALDFHNKNRNTCETCGEHFSAPSNLRSHQLTHRSRNIECFCCNRDFVTYSAMLIHLEAGNCAGTNTDYDDLNRYAAECYQWKKYVIEDKRWALMNSRARPYKDHDGYNFYSQEWECPACDKTFEKEGGYNCHVRSPVHDPWFYQCPGCGLSFSALSALLSHVESEACGEGIDAGSGSIRKMLHYLHLRL